MALLCYNKGCREKFDTDKNKDGIRDSIPSGLSYLTSDKNGVKHNREEIIYQEPKSAEAPQKKRPSSDEDETKLLQKRAIQQQGRTKAES
ncbi:hypothetical protein J4Q44_G00375560 [Coregonus suidteri]|uniref:Uncharacterized protein n=1 Tax=Coregonus suidteri TaxID=861788 RepID=A0AAN8Q9T1_9TELE